MISAVSLDGRCRTQNGPSAFRPIKERLDVRGDERVNPPFASPALKIRLDLHILIVRWRRLSGSKGGGWIGWWTTVLSAFPFKQRCPYATT